MVCCDSESHLQGHSNYSADVGWTKNHSRTEARVRTRSYCTPALDYYTTDRVTYVGMSIHREGESFTTGRGGVALWAGAGVGSARLWGAV